MLPIVVAGGLAIALSFIFGIEAFKEKGTLAASLMDIGGGAAAFALMIPVLAGFIAFSIADRPGLAPGLVGGMLASQLQAGFLGGIVAGFLAGYVARYLRDHIKLPVHFEGLKPVLLIPLLATLVVGLLMIYVVGSPARAIMEGLTQFLQSLSGTNAVLLGLLLGGMMAVDMGGPINKAAYTFGVGLLASNTFMPMAAVMAAGMVPPLGIALATFVAKNRFSVDEQIAGKAAAVLGISFITEGAIPFAAKDPLARDSRLCRRRGDDGRAVDVFWLHAARAARRHLRAGDSQRRRPVAALYRRHCRRYRSDHAGPDRAQEAPGRGCGDGGLASPAGRGGLLLFRFSLNPPTPHPRAGDGSFLSRGRSSCGKNHPHDGAGHGRGFSCPNFLEGRI
jgi:fructose-specific phosphotransferase system IIC component